MNSALLQQIANPQTPHFVTPLERQQQSLSAINAIQQTQGNALTLQDKQQDLAYQQQQRAKAERVHNILLKHQGDIEKALPEVMAEDPTLGTALAKQLQDTKKTGLDLTKTQQEIDFGKNAEQRAATAATNTSAKAQFDLLQEQRKAKEPKKLDEFYNKEGKRVISLQQPDGTITYEVGPEAGAAPRAQVPGTDIPLPPAVERQRVRIAAAEAAAKRNNTDIDPLVQSVIANPELYNQLTPTKKGEIAPKLNALGFSAFGKPLSDGAIKQITESEVALESLKDLRGVLKTNEQYIGPLAGLQALNPYSEGNRAQADIDRVRQRVGKALEGGVLRKEDEEKYKKILATLRDTPETALYKIDSLVKDVQRQIDIFKTEQGKAGRNVDTNTNAPFVKPGGALDGLLKGNK